MQLIEILLLLFALAVGVAASVIDLRKSIIPNKLIFPGMALAMGISAIYYWDDNSLMMAYFTNVGAMFIMAIMLYMLHVWGGGDAKLLMFLSLAYPVPLYFSLGNSVLPLLSSFLYIFSFGYIYLIWDSVKRSSVEKCHRRFVLSWKMVVTYLESYFWACSFAFLLDTVLMWQFSGWVDGNPVLLFIMNAMLIFTVSGFSFLHKRIVWIPLLCTDIFMMYLIKMPITVQYILLIAAILLIMAAKDFMAQYNYRSVKTTELKPGMILSAGSYVSLTAAGLKSSKPYLSEDLRSKLTEEDVKKIFDLKKCPATIMTVQKVPFAIFIVAGMIYFFFRGIMLL